MGKVDVSVAGVVELFQLRGDSEYGGEAVTQLEHGLQAALLAEEEGASAELIVAALLHDVGHLLHDLPDDAPEQGVDDVHETSGKNFLRKIFPDAVVEPIALHVAAKRYLCAVDGDYMAKLSEPSQVSLGLQGGPMNSEEVQQFEAGPFFKDALRLRYWDDTAKVADLETPTLEHYARYMQQVAL